VLCVGPQRIACFYFSSYATHQKLHSFPTRRSSDLKNANRGDAVVGQADDFAAGAAEFTLQRLNPRGRGVEMLLEEAFKNIQGHRFPSIRSGEMDPAGRPLA